MARPSKYTPALADAIVAALADGLTKKDAALVAGVHPETVDNWARRYPGFSTRLAQAEAERAKTWLAGIRRIAVDERDFRAYADLLDRCAPDYRKVHKSEQTITLDVRQAAERAAARLGLPVDVVLSEVTRWAEDEA